MGLADRLRGSAHLLDGACACDGRPRRLDALSGGRGLSNPAEHPLAPGQSGPGPEHHCGTDLVARTAGGFGNSAVLAGLRAVVAAAGGFQRRSV